jgi:hypothetical protein
MKRIRGWWLSVAITAVSVGPVCAAAPPPRLEPLKGVVTGGVALVCEWDTRYSNVTAWHQRLRGGKPRKIFCSSTFRLAPRWHVSHGALWVNYSSGRSLLRVADGLKRYELPQLLEGRHVEAPGAKPLDAGSLGGIVGAEPVMDKRYIGRAAEFRYEVFYDYLPSARFATRLFVLSNIAGSSTPAGKTDRLRARYFPRHGPKTPMWSLVCHSVRLRYLPKKKAWDYPWETGEWQEEDHIEVRFREPFQAMARGEDYYFLTASGKLYRAARPAKGNRRKLEVVWADGKSPITAYVHDADTGRIYLFCEVAGRPTFFELASRARCRHYEAKLFQPGDAGPKTLRRMIGYARVLLALRLIKSQPAPPQLDTRSRLLPLQEVRPLLQAR